MKKTIYILLLILITQTGYTQVAPADTVFYPSKTWFNDYKFRLKKINLINSDLNFKKIKRLVNKIHQNDSIPYFEIRDKNLIRKIIPLRYDWGLYIERDFLNVTEDSILIDNNYSIDKLYDQLKEHYFNNGKNPNHSQSKERATIKILIDSSRTGEYLANHINLIAREFDKLNQKHSDSLELKIVLDYPNRVPPPPSPPN